MDLLSFLNIKPGELTVPQISNLYENFLTYLYLDLLEQLSDNQLSQIEQLNKSAKLSVDMILDLYNKYCPSPHQRKQFVLQEYKKYFNLSEFKTDE